MININELMSVILKIRNSADRITTNGHENRELINFIYNTCNELLEQLNDIREKVQKEQEDASKIIPDNIVELKGENQNETNENA